MKKKEEKLNNNIDDSIFNFYLVPFISSGSIYGIISGSYFDSTYKIMRSDFQSRGMSIIFLLISIYFVYVFYKEVKKAVQNSNDFKNLKNKFFKSIFFYLWIIMIISPILYIFVYSFIPKIYFYYFIVLTIICFFFQMKFIKNIRNCIK